jgi:hypothetical protein
MNGQTYAESTVNIVIRNIAAQYLTLTNEEPLTYRLETTGVLERVERSIRNNVPNIKLEVSCGDDGHYDFIFTGLVGTEAEDNTIVREGITTIPLLTAAVRAQVLAAAANNPNLDAMSTAYDIALGEVSTVSSIALNTLYADNDRVQELVAEENIGGTDHTKAIRSAVAATVVEGLAPLLTALDN